MGNNVVLLRCALNRPANKLPPKKNYSREEQKKTGKHVRYIPMASFFLQRNDSSGQRRLLLNKLPYLYRFVCVLIKHFICEQKYTKHVLKKYFPLSVFSNFWNLWSNEVIERATSTWVHIAEDSPRLAYFRPPHSLKRGVNPFARSQ
jgi:hypothetical protein